MSARTNHADQHFSIMDGRCLCPCERCWDPLRGGCVCRPCRASNHGHTPPQDPEGPGA